MAEEPVAQPQGNEQGGQTPNADPAKAPPPLDLVTLLQSKVLSQS